MKIGQGIEELLKTVPKTELHLHLEGSIPVSAMYKLIQKYSDPHSLITLDELTEKFRFSGFEHFLEMWVWKNQFLREYEDFTMIAEAMAIDLREQNIRYAEVFYSPVGFERSGLEVQKLTDAIRTGLTKVAGIEVSLVADLVRNYGPVRAENTLNKLREVKELGVIGIGIGGAEQKYPPSPFKNVFEKAREFGFYTNAHAGEAMGADSIWGAVTDLKVDRIGHGMRAFEDKSLIDHLCTTQIPIEMCPLSNFRTGVASNIEDYPIRDYFDRGLMITVNTDDPHMFSNSLAEEFKFLHQNFDFNIDEIVQLMTNSISSSWLSLEKKNVLNTELQNSLNTIKC